MNDHKDTARYLPLLFIGSVALAALLLWVSDLTGGPEYGGRYDVPEINHPAWFGFLMSAGAAVLLGLANAARLADRIALRREKSRSIAGS